MPPAPRHRRRRSLANWFTNWERSDIPVPLRLVVAARNISIRLTRGDHLCCGHMGEPGC